MGSSINQPKAIWLLLLSFTLSCQKEVSFPEADPNRPDTGTHIQARGVCNFNQDDLSLTANGWKKVLEDNFDGNLDKWKILTGGSDLNQLQYYQTANLQVKDGSLKINVKRETVQTTTSPSDPEPKTFNFTSGGIISVASFSAGRATPKVRIATRVKLPFGSGMIPVIYSFDNPWPERGQIILLQGQGDRANYYETNYHYGSAAGTNLVRDAYGFITTDLSLTDCYHVFETEWSQNALKYYLDGRLIEVKTSGGYISSLFGKAHHLVFLIVVDGAAPLESIQVGTMYIDWIRIYTAT